ncbi:membrane protein insertion efficiency factor YidD [Kaistia terrae]|uniref:Putative membrane protein insertion efficiency factor n=1 Tax=Kaistia terrae TaxID=537017 RepID=A0ABW0PSB8_9HYPH|nr:membrane protein insertion efficiency factor YidD [Kaistia terrae]
MATTRLRGPRARRPDAICTSTAHPDGCAHGPPPEGTTTRLGSHLSPARWPGLIGIGLIRVYKLTLSPFIGQNCRYLPTCSSYGEECIRRYGLWAGGWMTLARFQRCGPFGASGYDPVPETLPGEGRWFLPWRYGQWTGKHIDPKTRLDL